ncbi:hypothetical protein [uncultured Mameliella sp.]|uniref:hypothetical protein n=1 Tax=uncultured Mameliella sp. TaxID=1447087 RepID=UPI002632B7C7|nr:hypothetical protein [uncultured Mameliella sp.]
MNEGKSAKALRAAGYVPLPRWWVTQDQLEVIRRIAMGNEGEVNRIRNGGEE